ncbi:MAG TPA: GDSL-type esterase/lipase family protein [Sphingobacterium sp.]|nr:GDSL-type esterase/lipase family protein [Sphingobacterium sp.]
MVWTFVLFTLQIVKGQDQVAIDSNYIFSGYTERLEHFKKMPVTHGAIVFLGNSLTDAGRWNDIIAGQAVLNRGISGDISYGVLARLDEVLRHKPKKIFLMIGVNDLKRNVPTENIIQNYARILQKIQQESSKTTIYLNSILPINPNKLIESFKTVSSGDIQVLNTALYAWSQANKRVHYIDLHQVVADSQGYLREDITPDGIHLEVAAYVGIVDYLRKVKAL